MSKKRKGSFSKSHTKRDVYTVSSRPDVDILSHIVNIPRRLSSPYQPILDQPIRDPFEFSEIEDYRQWQPTGRKARQVASLSSRPAKVVTPSPVSMFSPIVQAFQYPKHVVTCVRRKVRKEVLFALGHGGRGSRRPKRRNPRSNIKC